MLIRRTAVGGRGVELSIEAWPDHLKRGAAVTVRTRWLSPCDPEDDPIKAEAERERVALRWAADLGFKHAIVL